MPLVNPELAHLKVEPGDIILFRGGGWISNKILKLSTADGEDESLYSHVGIYIEHGSVYTAQFVEAVHPYSRATTLSLGYCEANPSISIARCINLSDETRRNIATESLKYVGRRYGWLKLGLHLIDSKIFGDRYVSRRLARSSMPICSWVVTKAYGAYDLNFGVPGNAAQPDDIGDYCSRSGKYDFVTGYFSYFSNLRDPLKHGLPKLHKIWDKDSNA